MNREMAEVASGSKLVEAKRTGKVIQKYIDWLLEDGGPRIPTFAPLDNYTGSDAHLLRAILAPSVASGEIVRAHNADILEQCRTKGYAQVEMEEESWLDDDKLWVVQLAKKKLAARKKMAASA